MAATKVQNRRRKPKLLRKASRQPEELRKNRSRQQRRRKIADSPEKECPRFNGVVAACICLLLDFFLGLLRRNKGTPGNPFRVLMFIHLDPSHDSQSGRQHPATTPRRVLLDTGAEFNLISHGAFAELHLTEHLNNDFVRSIGGTTKLEGTVSLDWHFPSLVPSLNHPLILHRAPFHILPPDADAMFDCIIGRQWIQENPMEFVALFVMNLLRTDVA
ncbi:hypothetical protein ABEF95_011512 [Exophiala dermatitidis]